MLIMQIFFNCSHYVAYTVNNKVLEIQGSISVHTRDGKIDENEIPGI